MRPYVSARDPGPRVFALAMGALLGSLLVCVAGMRLLGSRAGLVVGV